MYNWTLGTLVLLALASAASGDVVPAPKTGEKWVERHEAINAIVKKGDVGLIFVGDSVAQGWENFGKDTWAKFYPRRKGVNLGIAGDKAENIVWRLEHGNVDGITPRLAIVTLGTDYPKESAPEEIASGMKAVVDKLKEKLPKTRVLMVGLLPHLTKDDPRRAVTTKANELIKKLVDAKAGVFFHDVGYAFLDDDGTVEKDLMPDGAHLSEKGYQQLGDFVDPMIGSLLNETGYATTPVPQAKADWWYPHVKKLNERVKQGNVDMIFVGDSLANAYVNVGKETWDKYYAKRNAVNLGISTNYTQNELWQLEHGNVDGISPKLAVVLVGAPNAVGGGTTEDAAAGVKAIVDKLREKLPKTKVLLLGLFPQGETKDFPKRVAIEKVNAVICKLADDKMVFYMDINSNFLNADGTMKKDLFKPDMVHLESKGYAVWAEGVEPMVKKLMEEK